MDKLTHISLTNCIKELDALKELVASGNYDTDRIADWISEISWNLTAVFRRERYNSDEFQHRLRKLIKEKRALSSIEEEEESKKDQEGF